MEQSIMKTMSPIFPKQMNNQVTQKASQSNKQYTRDSNSEMVQYSPEMYEEVLAYFSHRNY